MEKSTETDSKIQHKPLGMAFCEHKHNLFIQSSRSMPDGERSEISICPDCGQFYIFAWKNGAHVEIRFALASDELVKAAGKYLDIIKKHG